MWLVHVALLHAAACLDMQVEGDLAFDLRVPSVRRGKQRWFRVGWVRGSQPKELVFKMQARQHMTAAPEVECTYQYPEKQQVDALLSNMMNELTKVFVKANDFIHGAEVRRRGADDVELQHYGNYTKDAFKKEFQTENLMEKEMNPDPNKDVANDAVPTRRREDSRFKVVKKKQKVFFEVIYSNMTDEYRQLYKRAAGRVARSGRDPCRHQPEVRQLWRHLLEQAESVLRAAAQRCVAEFLRELRVPPGSKLAARLGQYLARELAKLRANQLDMLCDRFQLCYNDLLE